MKAIKRHLPLVIISIILAVNIAIALLIGIGQLGTRVTLNSGKSEALAEFTLHGEMFASNFTQMLTLENGEIKNKFKFIDDNSVYYRCYPQMAQAYPPSDTDYSKAQYNKEGRYYKLAANEAAIVCKIYENRNRSLFDDAPSKMINVDTGLKLNGELEFTANPYRINDELFYSSFSLRIYDNPEWTMCISQTELDGKTYFSLNTNKAITGERGVWCIEQMEAAQTKHIEIDGNKFEDALAPTGKVIKCITAQAGMETVTITNAGGSLCVFGEMGGKLYLMVYAKSGEMTDNLMVNDDIADNYITLCPQENANDLAFIVQGKAMALRIENGKIVNKVAVDNLPNDDVFGITLNDSADKMLVASTFLEDENQSYMRVYDESGKIAEETINSYHNEIGNNNFVQRRGLLFNTKEIKTWKYESVGYNVSDGERWGIK
ncbi:MAG: hypothetical protein RR424_08405 [Oscillospiraceae bacterium]